MLSSLFWKILNIVTTTIEWYVFRFILGKVSSLKEDKLTLNISFTMLILVTTTLNFMNVSPNIKLSTGVVIGFIFYIFNYEVSILKSIVVCLIYWMLLLSFDSISAGIVLTINSISNVNKILNNNIFRLELIIISKLLLLSLIPIFKIFRLQVDIKKRDFIYVCIPIIANILSIIVIFGYAFEEGRNSFIENIVIFIVSSLLLLSNISLIIVIHNIIRDSKLRLENSMIKEKIDMQYNYYLKLQDNQMRIRKLYHDMKNHMICIENIYGNSDVTKNYIDSINLEINSCEPVFETGNMILDIILSEKKSICDKNNIEFFADINFLKCNFIDMIDVCSIFSNILDNAIEACNKIDDENIGKYIRIRGTIVKEFFILKVENSKANKIITKNNKVITDKKDSFLHGIGINSIKNSIEKYNGEVVADYSEDKFIMNIYIPLQ
ncbi:two-component signal transduction sensor histidine kinase [Gottschalkia purinilytica]|uniref:Two-component signal transduction sensor histidine kinase n=1 Tax=Gottschalkia purinilytica TaxID=1503 RepID=A0A0L0W8Q8_GOTPU|nr:ATP-binding protein [Gottschalkia purinilytica]KNF07929.1 two-component signal transduction sensor histidine kinase [Gottschalkia purinilytica]